MVIPGPFLALAIIGLLNRPEWPWLLALRPLDPRPLDGTYGTGDGAGNPGPLACRSDDPSADA